MRIKIIQDTVLKQEKAQSTALPDSDKFTVLKGFELEVNWVKSADDNQHVLVELTNPVKGYFNWFIFADHIELEKPKQQDLVTLPQARFVFGKNTTQYKVDQLNKCLVQFDITTLSRIRHFMAQIGHESGGLVWFAELATGAAYEGRKDLGNIYPGDGRRFKGIGAIQVTGRSNYQKFADYIGDQRVMEGWQYVLNTYGGFLPSGHWWYRNGMNQLIDRGASVRDVTKRVNGGVNGLADRVAYYDRACQVIN